MSRYETLMEKMDKGERMTAREKFELLYYLLSDLEDSGFAEEWVSVAQGLDSRIPGNIVAILKYAAWQMWNKR